MSSSAAISASFMPAARASRMAGVASGAPGSFLQKRGEEPAESSG
jgi:hypothetical protein